MELYPKYLLNGYRMDDDDDEPKEKDEKTGELSMLMKRMEKYFFQTKSKKNKKIINIATNSGS